MSANENRSERSENVYPLITNDVVLRSLQQRVEKMVHGFNSEHCFECLALVVIDLIELLRGHPHLVEPLEAAANKDMKDMERVCKWHDQSILTDEERDNEFNKIRARMGLGPLEAAANTGDLSKMTKYFMTPNDDSDIMFPLMERLFEMTRKDRQNHDYSYVTKSYDGWTLTLRFEKPCDDGCDIVEADAQKDSSE